MVNLTDTCPGCFGRGILFNGLPCKVCYGEAALGPEEYDSACNEDTGPPVPREAGVRVHFCRKAAGEGATQARSGKYGVYTPIHTGSRGEASKIC